MIAVLPSSRPGVAMVRSLVVVVVFVGVVVGIIVVGIVVEDEDRGQS
jgi:hypothetical protein